MRTRTRWLLLAPSLVMALGLGSRPAAAASFLRVSYTVTGGAFNGPALSGPITGGTISYRTPDGVTVAPPYGSACTGSCGFLTQLTLTGAAGTFRLLTPTVLDLLGQFATLTPRPLVMIANSIPASKFSSGGGALTGVGASVTNVFISGAPALSANLELLEDYYGHAPEIGNEVRAVVPEPTTGPLLGLGLGLLGLAGGARGRRALKRP